MFLRWPNYIVAGCYLGPLLTIFGTLCAVSLASLQRRSAKRAMQTRLCERLAERARIARDLHDTFFPGVQGLLLTFQTASRRLPSDHPTRILLEEALLQSDRVMLEARELLLDLRSSPNGPAELENDLAAAAAEFARVTPAAFRVAIQGPPMELCSTVREELRRLCREAIHNAFRHAKASEIIATVVYGKSELQITIQDNGRGMPRDVLRLRSAPNRWGLLGMKERAAEIGAHLFITSTPDFGTEISVRLSARLAYRADDGSVFGRLSRNLSGSFAEIKNYPSGAGAARQFLNNKWHA